MTPAQLNSPLFIYYPWDCEILAMEDKIGNLFNSAANMLELEVWDKELLAREDDTGSSFSLAKGRFGLRSWNWGLVGEDEADTSLACNMHARKHHLAYATCFQEAQYQVCYPCNYKPPI